MALSNDALKTIGTPTPRGDRRNRDGDVDGVRVALDDARAEDEGERVTGAERDTAPAETGVDRLHLRDRLFGVERGCPCAPGFCRLAASTKLANSGCGFSGRDWNSGWNCTATNHGWPGSSAISTNLPSGDRPEMRMPFSRSAGS